MTTRDWFERARQRLNHMLTGERYGGSPLVSFFGFIKWSKLAAIGNSNLVRLTILVPFFGSVILFNEQISSLFRYSDDFLVDIGVSPDSLSKDKFAISRLYFFYFGLSFLGLGAFLYSLRCPEEIREIPSVKDFVFAQESLHSPVITKSNFRYILESHGNILERSSSGDAIGFPKKLKYPPNVEYVIYNLGHELFHSFDWNWNNDDDDDEAPPEPISPPEDESGSAPRQGKGFGDDPDAVTWDGTLKYNYVMGSGYPNIDQMLSDLYDNPKVIWAFTIPFLRHALNFSKDIAFTKFIILDNSRPFTRLFVAFFYSSGFIILFIPTGETFIRLLAGVIF
ncbi:hypothetical protein [Mesorhizobium sp. M0859]|uniref:hypothetical protein n=1 Tax=Mesorhizobium sp. M0859 TaxID=2957014 RepID=UPI003339CDCA